MSEIPDDELRDIFSEHLSPDPYLLIETAPLIPRHLLARAIQVALEIKYPLDNLRAKAVEALASRLDADSEYNIEETLVAARAVYLRDNEGVEPALLRTIAPVVPEELLPRALELASHIVRHDERIDVLVRLVDRLNTEDRTAVLRQVLHEIESSVYDLSRSSTLELLVPHLSGRLAGRARVLVETIQDHHSKACILIILAKKARGRKRVLLVEEALGLIWNLKNSSEKARMIAVIAPLLSTEQRAETIKAARKIHDFSSRIEALTGLISGLRRREQQPILLRLLAQVKRHRKKEIRAKGLAQLVPLLKASARAEIIGTIVRLIRKLRSEQQAYEPPPGLVDVGYERWQSWRYAEGRGMGAAELLEKLGHDERVELVSEAVADAYTIRDRWSRSRILEKLESVLPESLMSPITEAEQEIKAGEEAEELDYCIEELPNNTLNIDYLAGIIERLPEKESNTRLEEIMEKARLIQDSEEKADVMATFAGLLQVDSRAEIIGEISGLADSVEEPVRKAILKSELVHYMPEAEIGPVLEELLDFSGSVEDEYDRLAILEGIIPALPEEKLDRVIESTETFSEIRLRADILRQVALRVSYPQFEPAFENMLTVLESHEDEFERCYLLRMLVPFLPMPLYPRAREVAESITMRDRRADALAVVLSNMARLSYGMIQRELVREAFTEAFLTSLPSGGRGGRSAPAGITTGGGRAGKLLTSLSEDRKNGLLEQWLGNTQTVPEERVHLAAKMEEDMPVFDEMEATYDELLLDEAERSDELVQSARRVVNTGFSTRELAGEPLSRNFSLAAAMNYYFWLEVGEVIGGTIEIEPVPLPAEYLPSEAILKVALFGYEDGIRIMPDQDVGELILAPDGTASVYRQPAEISGIPDNLLERRLFFPVSTPENPGVVRLRCNTYCEQVLVQARLIEARVTEQPEYYPDVLSSVVDYTLSRSLRPQHLAGLGSHKLSFMLNNADGVTHAFVFGQKDNTMFKNEAALSSTELVRPIENVRETLGKVSWGTREQWVGQLYRYGDRKPDRNRFEQDIISLAVSGYILYNAFIDRLSGGRQKSYQLADLMLKPGLIQIALKQSPAHVLPAAFFYDHPLDTQAAELTLCDAFIDSLSDSKSLEETDCFNGECPNYNRLDCVCPSGFWGYRHFLGMPLSLGEGLEGNGTGDVESIIHVRGNAEVVAGVATNLDRVNEHMQEIRTLRANLGWNYSENRDDILDMLKQKKAHVIYFYCHGVKGANKALYLQVGGGDEYIEGSNLRSRRIYWDDPKPLVFINGCQTTAVEPEQALNLVQDFIGTGGAGVIGTEVTVFESLACDFAEEFLRLFLEGNMPAGEAIRKSRLKLLKEMNPLGLVYTSYAIPSLQMKTV